MPNKCNKCEQDFRNEKALSKHTKDKHRVSYYGMRVVPVLLVLGLIVVFIYYYGNVQPLSNNGNTVHENIFDLSFPIVNGNGLTNENLKLSDLSGHPIVLEFMLSTCSHCQNMAPVVEDVYSEYGSSVLFLSVAGSRLEANANSTAEFIRTYNSTYVHIYDVQNIIFDHFSVTGTPTYLFFNSDGTLSNTVSGEMSKSSMISEINKLI